MSRPTYATSAGYWRRYQQYLPYERRIDSGHEPDEEWWIWRDREMRLDRFCAAAAAYRIEDEARLRGANFIQGGLFRAFAVRDGQLITGQQQYSGAKVAVLVIQSLGR